MYLYENASGKRALVYGDVLVLEDGRTLPFAGVAARWDLVDDEPSLEDFAPAQRRVLSEIQEREEAEAARRVELQAAREEEARLQKERDREALRIFTEEMVAFGKRLGF